MTVGESNAFLHLFGLFKDDVGAFADGSDEVCSVAMVFFFSGSFSFTTPSYFLLWPTNLVMWFI